LEREAELKKKEDYRNEMKQQECFNEEYLRISRFIEGMKQKKAKKIKELDVVDWILNDQ